jgi:hypothetical protein
MATQTREKDINHLHLRVPRVEKRKFQRACKRAGFTQSDVLRRLMTDFTEGNITYTETVEIAN